MSRRSRAIYGAHLNDNDDPDVKLIENRHYVILDNGIVRVTLSKPAGIVTGIKFGGLDNLLEIANKEKNRGYWDLNWNKPGGSGIFDVVEGTDFSVVDYNADKVEVSFVRTYDPSREMVPLTIDKRFILMRGNSGFYSYAIYEHMAGWADFDLIQTRIAFKLRKDRFRYMAIADDKQRLMPFPEDRDPNNCQQLAYPEAVILTHPKDPEFQGEVDDKYQYSADNKDNRVHGWISFDSMVGFWIIFPSDEFRNGGNLKQNLTSHVGPTSLSMFHSGHYAGDPLFPKFRGGEPWKKVFGPVLVYLNSATLGTPSALWEDAKEQMFSEVQSWPYDWPASQDFLKVHQRGDVSGRLLVKDWFAFPNIVPARSAYLGLALPGEKGSWQTESKGYQFWTQSDENGYFRLSNVCAGEYNLYGWVPGVLGEYKKEGSVIIQPGSLVDLQESVFDAPRDGKTVWEIGIPDRSSTEFYIPDPDPKFVNRLYLNHPERYRQYGLWLRYSELYPDTDLVYDVQSNDWSNDWFFAHVGRVKEDGSLVSSTWQVQFQLESVVQTGLYKLRLAFASANFAVIQVRFNDPDISTPHFDTKRFGTDNAIARHGKHGLYRAFDVDVLPQWLQEGKNAMYLTLKNPQNLFVGAMYDYLRLEEPASQQDHHLI
ncbi:hypothetical protein GOP47_0007311 [Adiantum capillus-veneris]|uniref:rhamnogalacturonan endolyase n=1 Tax=Adiantum capillus-veneris TaxID=13818 RepID=A0A9D4V1W5_ADICA|nr:hypothetical protein GOP47_0007311 [Adiantum capillus-veneris]